MTKTARTLSECLDGTPNPVLALSGLLFVVILGAIDYLTGPDLSFLIFYLFPIAAVAWFGGFWSSLLVSVASASAWVIADTTARPASFHLIIPLWNVIGKGIVFCAVAYTVSTLRNTLNREKELNRKLERTITELTNLNKEMEAFSYTVSHDLRTPLMVIGGFSRRLIAEFSGKLDDRGREELHMIQEATEKMGGLIDGLLALSHSGRHEMKHESVDMDNLAKDVVRELTPLIPEKTTIHIHSLPPAYGDLRMLRQVLYNFLANAVKFSREEEKPLIEIGCMAGPHENAYYVKDNGVGFDMQEAYKLFVPFQRLYHSKEFEGTGIGLATIQRIISRHGGKVWVEGRINEGGTFYFSLPRNTEQAGPSGIDTTDKVRQGD
jgi:signal transduction histidine kinase